MTTALTPSTRRPATRPPAGARRVGYLIAMAINVALIWLVNVTPGWRWVPFVTEDFTAVLWLVNLSLIAGAAANVIYVFADPQWLRRLGDAFTATIAAVVLFQMAVVFPFDFSAGWSWAGTPFRALLVLGCLGTLVAVVVNIVQALRHTRDRAQGEALGQAR